MSEEFIRFDIAGMRTEAFATLPNNKPAEKEAEIQLGLSFGISPETEHIISVMPRVEFLDPETEKPFLIAELQCFFALHPDDWASFENEEKTRVTFPKSFIWNISTIAVGALRGVIHAKTERTEIQPLLPPIDLTQIVAEDVVLDLDSDAEQG